MSPKMAADIATADMSVLKNSKILVDVNEVLADLLVVSYFNENRTFQGVLLDSTKRNLPFGVSSLHPAFLSQKDISASGQDGDKLFSVSQRFGYQEPEYAYVPKVAPKSKMQQRKAKMTVRLRPRKVLCSNCRGICNENSENVAQTRSRRNIDNPATKTSASNKINVTNEENRTLIMGHSLIPKLSRLHPSEISNAMNGNAYTRNEIWLQQEKSDLDMDDSSNKTKNSDGSRDSNADCLIKSDLLFSSSEGNSDNRFIDDSRDNFDEARKQKTKKRVESFLDGEETSSSLFSNARTLKISFGVGEGTVLKLPAMGDFNNEEPIDNPEGSNQKSESKAAKRALKKAKRQARKQDHPMSISSKEETLPLFQKKHKHKVKHKKKNKDDKKMKENPSESDSRSADDNFSVKKHKLSVNMKQLDEKMDMMNEGSSESGSEAGLVESEAGAPQLSPGAVVWGRLQGFPWWPGRVLTLGCDGTAHVVWYASTTSSTMPLHRLSPFLENFKVRFNKKKRGLYKEAVRLASLEAQSSDPLDPLAILPTQGASFPTLSSPPIDVHS